jgi:hypothetical protein
VAAAAAADHSNRSCFTARSSTLPTRVGVRMGANCTMGRKLWLLTGGALAVGLAIDLLDIFVPSLRDESPLVLLLVAGIWSALSLLVLLAEARRIHKVVVLIALVLAVTLSFSTHWFGFAAFVLVYFGAILFIGTVLVFAALRLFRKRPSLRALVLPLTMTIMGACGVLLSAWSSRPVPPIPEQAMSTSDELKYIYDVDQADRGTGYWMIDPKRDRIRLERVKALYRAGQITKPTDQYAAALVYQHGSCADEFQVAYELATAAASHGIPAAGQLSMAYLTHATYDRWQLSLGKPQTYGTQFPPVPIKRPCPPAQ